MVVQVLIARVATQVTLIIELIILQVGNVFVKLGFLKMGH